LPDRLVKCTQGRSNRKAVKIVQDDHDLGRCKVKQPTSFGDMCKLVRPIESKDPRSHQTQLFAYECFQNQRIMLTLYEHDRADQLNEFGNAQTEFSCPRLFKPSSAHRRQLVRT
jgi:hypothetical protein